MIKFSEMIKQYKYKKQRAEKGYCDFDIYEIDSWFFKIIPNMLKELYNHVNGIPQQILDEYYSSHKLELLKYGYKDSSYIFANAEFTNKELDKKIENECFIKWKDTIKQMIFYFKESQEENCLKKNKYDDEYSKASKEFRKKYGNFGEKLLTKEELLECKKKDSYPCKLMSDFPEYKDIDSKFHNEEIEIQKYRQEARNRALGMFCKYLESLYW